MNYWIFNRVLYLFSLGVGFSLLIGSYGADIIDRISYVTMIEDFPLFLEQRIDSSNLVLTLLNESLWVFLMGLCYYLKFDTEIYIISICCLSYFIVMKNVMRSTKHFYRLLPIVLSAGFLVNFITHIRQGIALSILVFSIYLLPKPRIKRPIFYWITPLIHNSFFFITIYFYYEQFVNGAKSVSKMRLVLIGSLFLLVLLFFISFATERQSHYVSDIGDETKLGIGWLYWFFLFLVVQGASLRSVKLDLSKEALFIVVYLILYPLIPTIAGRLMEVFVLFIFIWLQTRIKSPLYNLFAVAYFIMSWISRYDEYYFGFGA